jgi:signal transduction histidine kinase
MKEVSCILLVDNTPEGLKTLLARDGYQLLFATQSTDAFEQAKNYTPDLILLNINTVDAAHFELCQLIRGCPKLVETPIILLLESHDDVLMQRALEAGVDDFIVAVEHDIGISARIRTLTRLNRYHQVIAEWSRFEWVVEQTEDGYVVLKNGDDIMYANSSARLYLNLLRDDLSGESLIRQAKAHYQLEPIGSWENWPQPNLAQTARYLVRPENTHQSSLWLQVDIVEFPANKRNEQLVRLHNVSEQMNLERQIWTFQTLVSHKLRAPLNGLVSLELLSRTDLTQPRAHHLLNIANESAKRLRSQVIDILRYVDSSQLLMQTQKNLPLNCFAELVHRVSNELNLASLSVSVADELLKRKVNLSIEGIEMIMRELLTNAQKFHPQYSPEINISIVPQEHEMIQLTMTDNGRCLSSDELMKAWTPYYQVEKSFTGEVKGMGLGLAMIARLVWSRGGHCQLRNRMNHSGLIVEFTLPLQSE